MHRSPARKMPRSQLCVWVEPGRVEREERRLYGVQLKARFVFALRIHPWSREYVRAYTGILRRFGVVFFAAAPPQLGLAGFVQVSFNSGHNETRTCLIYCYSKARRTSCPASLAPLLQYSCKQE